MSGVFRRNVRKRSVVWGFFRTVDPVLVQCLLCRDVLVRRTRLGRGPTTNMLRHLRVKHPAEVFNKPPTTTSNTSTRDTSTSGPGEVEADGDYCSVEVVLEGGDSDAVTTVTTVNDAHISSALGGVLDAAAGAPAEQVKHEAAGEYRPVKARFKKRSLIWSHFEHLDSLDAARCRICRMKLRRYESGSTSNLHRHMKQSHPNVFPRRGGPKQQPPSQDANTTVNMVLGGGASEAVAMVNEADINSAINGLLEAAVGGAAEEEDPPVKTRCKKRSLIWRYFEHLENTSVARCRICMKQLQCFEGGSTSNLHRHMSSKHPEVLSQQAADRKPPPPPLTAKEVSLEDGESEPVSTVKEADVNSSNHAAAEQRPEEEEEEQEEEQEERTRPGVKRSSVWRHFVHLKSLSATRCNICMKKLHYDGSTTSNMHRHMSKRHPEVFCCLVTGGHIPPPPLPPRPSSRGPDVNGDTRTPAETDGDTETQSPGALRVSRACEAEKRVLRRERELVEALRRAQREEARALQQQRELLEKLRAVNAREAAAERENIEALRRAQLEAAEDLNRQREEVQREKAELQEKWEELRQEREELLLFSRDQQDS
ncbi:zinc finger BED domain-containing protein [Centropristis striata]|uniref:zinc finger BED domain-containing protein n=1 Tax=Centropristis striata TaxID=184440 RepID=UPI0027E20655|nr:zinc finger BED domain-containing protein [Centropristis striata]